MQKSHEWDEKKNWDDHMVKLGFRKNDVNGIQVGNRVAFYQGQMILDISSVSSFRLRTEWLLHG